MAATIMAYKRLKTTANFLTLNVCVINMVLLVTIPIEAVNIFLINQGKTCLQITNVLRFAVSLMFSMLLAFISYYRYRTMYGIFSNQVNQARKVKAMLIVAWSVGIFYVIGMSISKNGKPCITLEKELHLSPPNRTVANKSECLVTVEFTNVTLLNKTTFPIYHRQHVNSLFEIIVDSIGIFILISNLLIVLFCYGKICLGVKNASKGYGSTVIPYTAKDNQISQRKNSKALPQFQINGVLKDEAYTSIRGLTTYNRETTIPQAWTENSYHGNPKVSCVENTVLNTANLADNFSVSPSPEQWKVSFSRCSSLSEDDSKNEKFTNIELCSTQDIDDLQETFKAQIITPGITRSSLSAIPTISGNVPQTCHNITSHKQKKNQTRTVTNGIAQAILFLICCTPYVIASIQSLVIDVARFPRYLILVSYYLMYLMGAVYPLWYIVADKGFRSHAKKLMLACCCRLSY